MGEGIRVFMLYTQSYFWLMFVVHSKKYDKVDFEWNHVQPEMGSPISGCSYSAEQLRNPSISIGNKFNWRSFHGACAWC